MSNKEIKKNYDDVSNLLKNNVVKVIFTKVNGEKRTMRCTLREDLLPPVPEDTVPSTKLKRPVNTAIRSCWSIDDAGWRSFRLDSIVEMIVEDGN